MEDIAEWLLITAANVERDKQYFVGLLDTAHQRNRCRIEVRHVVLQAWYHFVTHVEGVPVFEDDDVKVLFDGDANPDFDRTKPKGPGNEWFVRQPSGEFRIWYGPSIRHYYEMARRTRRARDREAFRYLD